MGACLLPLDVVSFLGLPVPGPWILAMMPGGFLFFAYMRLLSPLSPCMLATALSQSSFYERSLLPANLEIRCATFFALQIKQYRSYLDCFSSLHCAPSTPLWCPLCARRDFFPCKHALPWLVIATGASTSPLTARVDPVLPSL